MDFFHFFFLPGVGSQNYSGPGPGVTPGLAQAPLKSLSHAALPGAAAVPSLQGAAGEAGCRRSWRGCRRRVFARVGTKRAGLKTFLFWLRECPGAQVLPRALFSEQICFGG